MVIATRDPQVAKATTTNASALTIQHCPRRGGAIIALRLFVLQLRGRTLERSTGQS